jgi:hypothetical protein
MTNEYTLELQKELELLQHDPNLKTPDEMVKGEGILITRTFFGPMTIGERSGGKYTVIKFPQHGFRRTFSEPDLGDLMFKIIEELKRIRNYLAFVSGHSFTMNYIMASSHFMMPQTMEGKSYLNPNMVFPEHRREAENKLRNSLRLSYSTVDSLLNKVTVGSEIDRFISLMGFSLASYENEHSFLSLWKAIETAADIQFKEAINEGGDVEAFRKYLPEAKVKRLTEGKSIMLSSVDKLSVPLKKIGSDFSNNELKHLQELRNNLVHSSINSKESREIIQYYPKLYAVAQRLGYYLMERGKILKDAEKTLRACDIMYKPG